MIMHVVAKSEVLNNVSLVSLSPSPIAEADYLSLMVTTSSGARLYLSTTSGGFGPRSSDPPNSMQLRHIRLQPTDAQSAPSPQATQMPSHQGLPPLGFNSALLRDTKF